MSNNVCTQDNTIRIRYAGAVGNHLVPSPLRKFPSYGMHTNGDIFCVHIDDQRTAPAIFVLIEEPKVEAPAPVAAPTEEPIATVASAPETVVLDAPAAKVEPDKTTPRPPPASTGSDATAMSKRQRREGK